MLDEVKGEAGEEDAEASCGSWCEWLNGLWVKQQAQKGSSSLYEQARVEIAQSLGCPCAWVSSKGSGACGMNPRV